MIQNVKNGSSYPSLLYEVKVKLLFEVKRKRFKCEQENRGIQKEKAALTRYVKRAATGLAELEQLPAECGWIFNDPNQDAVITRGTDCHAGALCAEHPGICRLVLFMVPVPQVWHFTWFRSQRGGGGVGLKGGTGVGDRKRRRHCSMLWYISAPKCVRNGASRFFFAPGVCWKLGVQDGEKSDKTGEWSERRDSSEFSGKLTSSQHQCEDIILLARSRYLQVPWAHRTYGNLFPTSRVGTGSRWTPWGKNSAQVWKRLKHITKLTGFKDILLTSKLHHPPPTCLPHSPALLSPSHFLCLSNQDE